jgi:CO/xanthine dehydrogenase FAD-binding subunit
MIGEIGIPAANLGGQGRFTKLGIRNALAISIASVAVVVDREQQCRVAYGSLAPRPVRARELEAAIAAGMIAGRSDLEPYVSRATNPISDVRATDWYRREMAVNLTFMALCELELIGGVADNE